MTKLLGMTQSVCPDCLRRLDGRLVEDGDNVRLEKTCPEHGPFGATLWRGQPSFSSWFRPKIPFFGGNRHATDQGCPYDCGLCAVHGQRTCTALVEITSRCNLACPVCFADSGGSGTDPVIDDLARMFDNIMNATGGCNLQLSGGEPTVRADLPNIVALAKRAGFPFIQLNSNGLAFAQDPHLASRLQDEGLSSVFLQFDGMHDEVFVSLRGRRLLDAKLQAIDRLAAAGVGIVLVPTVVRDVNFDQLGELVRFGLTRQPHVRGVHFQPISYFGRYPDSFIPDHVTLPELMQGLASQTHGLLRAEDFRPPGCEHALCSFSARYLAQEDGSLQRLGGINCDCTPQPAEQGAQKAIGVTARQWRAAPVTAMAPDSPPRDDLDRFLHQARSHTFTVSAMAFQDAWSLNLERLRGCCIHIARPDGRLIPFCSYNLTARDGRSLHRPRKPTLKRQRTTVDGLVAKRLNLAGAWTREALEQAQLISLRRTIDHARTHSPFYRESLAEAATESLNSLADLSRLPLLKADDICKRGHLMLSVSQSKVCRIVTLQTSGSTGPPKRLFFSATDLAGTQAFFLSGMHNLVDTNDRVLVLLPFTQPDSVGDLLIRALQDGGIKSFGMWPPEVATAAVSKVRELKITCVVGLPQHLLGLAETVGPGPFRSMLLCSDYAAPALRKRIEDACGCETYLHYGTTESGLGGAVECGEHNGCHIRESELLVEIVDPATGRILPDGRMGEVVLTTLGREAMPLIRYRTGDTAALDRSPCPCGGVTARLNLIRGRLAGCRLANGGMLFSQDVDDVLFTVPGLLDYRLTIESGKVDSMDVSFVADRQSAETEIRRLLLQIPVIRDNLAEGGIVVGSIRRVKDLGASHTVKRTILDKRNSTLKGEPCSTF